MTNTDLVAILPLIVLVATTVVVLLTIAFKRDQRLTAGLTLVGLLAGILALPVAASVAPRQVTSLLTIDRYALFFMGLLLAASLFVGALAFGYLQRRTGQQEEFYALLLLATLGAAVLVASNHFAAFFLGLELLSVALYGLIAYAQPSRQGIEAGLKYLTLAAASAAFLLFGMALIYADQGVMAFDQLNGAEPAGGGAGSVFFLVGVGMLIVGIGFKLAVVPFHAWAPDVYEGAPAPVAAFIATVSKGAVFALLLRLSVQLNIQDRSSLVTVLGLVAVASMFGGNLLALLQHNVKRLLAYSSIAHLGYLLVAFLASGELAVTAAIFYLVAYFVTSLSAFGVLSVMSNAERDADDRDDYRGLFWLRPGLAAVFTTALLSLIGIPLTAGFVGKFYVVTAGVGSDLWWLVVALVVSSAIGLYYYLRLIVAMFLQPDGKRMDSGALVGVPLAGGFVLIALFLMLVWFGIYPAPLLETIQKAVSGLL
jgi:NADH-quinone oxidoreductase subunit N